jgi:hypothetical protein
VPPAAGGVPEETDGAAALGDAVPAGFTDGAGALGAGSGT